MPHSKPLDTGATPFCLQLQPIQIVKALRAFHTVLLEIEGEVEGAEIPHSKPLDTGTTPFCLQLQPIQIFNA